MKCSVCKYSLVAVALAALVYVGYSANGGSCAITSLMGGDEKTVATDTQGSADDASLYQAMNLPKADETGNYDASELGGKVAVINFWATWCPPCVAEIPHFVKVQDEYKDKGVQFVGISLDQAGMKTVNRFAEKHTINYPIVMGNNDVVSTFGNFSAIPTTFILNQDGEIAETFTGYVSEKDLKAALDKLID